MHITGLQTATPATRPQPKAAEQKTTDRFEFKQDCMDQASWLAQECRARFNCTPNELMKGPDGFERFNQLAIEWRNAHPRD